MTLYAKSVHHLVHAVLPRYTSMPSTAKLLAVEVIAMVYGKSVGEVARDVQLTQADRKSDKV